MPSASSGPRELRFFTDRDLGKAVPKNLREAGFEVETHAEHFPEATGADSQEARIRPLNLTAEERALLRLALDNPALRGRPALARRLRTLQAKLDAVSRAAEETPRALALAGPERSGAVPDGVMEALERAVTSRRRAEILYASLSGASRRWRAVDPYLLFHRDGAWYLAGHCHTSAEPRTFRLDRIAEARGSSRA